MAYLRCQACLIAVVVLSGPWLLQDSLLGQELPLEIPEPLKPWKDWVLWDDSIASAPTAYNDESRKVSVWSSELSLVCDQAQGNWSAQIQVFSPSWVPLPGEMNIWPEEVLINEQASPVIERDNVPSVRLEPGAYKIVGKFSWLEMPQKIAIPRSFGILNLSIQGEAIAIPNWDSQGFVWLKRGQANEEAEDGISLQVYRVIEDGVPMWLRTQVDISASGKSREESIGNVLPEGWQLSFVSSPIPVAVDELGNMKVQVRSGNWEIRVDAFRNTDLNELQFSEAVKPIVSKELIGIRMKPSLRTAELQGAMSVDAQMTTFPQAWRELPVYEWKTDVPLKWVEKTRGLGVMYPDKLQIRRQLWLDGDGKGLTYVDSIEGQPKQISRLDVARGHELGVVRIDGTRQLITENPLTRMQGVELRTSNPKIVAIGRATELHSLNATGWQSDADNLQLTMVLPPGWRMYAMFGADRVRGDWLTAWSLLDLFLLLIFTVAVYRIWGFSAGSIAFLAFGLSYHETGSPRLTWLFLLVPIAILHVVKDGRTVSWLRAWKNLAILFLAINAIPFAGLQIQNALYPQLERSGVSYSNRVMFDWVDASYNASASVSDYSMEDVTYDKSDVLSSSLSFPSSRGKPQTDDLKMSMTNMQFDAATSIQTGMAKPGWQGQEVQCYWDGPVSSEQRLFPILISCNMHRFVTIVRLVLLGLLAWVIVNGNRKFSNRTARVASNTTTTLSSIAIAGFLSLSPSVGWSQIPDPTILETLRTRLLPASDAYPHAANIASMRVDIRGGRLSIDAEVHAALDVAIPVPGKFPVWSPIRVSIDGKPSHVCRRDDQYLWVLIPGGVHRLSVDGLIDDGSEWVLDFELQPRKLQIDAPEWNITGLSPDGIAESQLFFVRKEQKNGGSAAYDQKNFRSTVVIKRQLEIGLVWKVHNTVERLSELGKAISIQIPLLSGERILSPNVNDIKGILEVNLGAEDSVFNWDSEMAVQESITLTAIPSLQAIEQWSLMSSPVWNVAFDGLQPIYESKQSVLIPIWYPWPEEKTTISFRQPIAVPGKTLTVQRLSQQMTLGHRQRDTHFELEVESSLGGEFPLRLPDSSVVTKVIQNNRILPIRKTDKDYLIALQPGTQSITIDWRSDASIDSIVRFPAIQLPTDAANVSTSLSVPESRWILWANGPIRGPAVRFWIILVVAIGLAIILAMHPMSPIGRIPWILLALGLTQVHIVAGLLVVAWLFLIVWRKKLATETVGVLAFNGMQVGLVILTVVVLGIFIVVVGEGLLGSPEMFILGNGSYRNQLNWFAPLSGPELPQPWILSVSVWYYRLLMLFWALWLANALIGWLKEGWQAFTNEIAWKGKPTKG